MCSITSAPDYSLALLTHQKLQESANQPLQSLSRILAHAILHDKISSEIEVWKASCNESEKRDAKESVRESMYRARDFASRTESVTIELEGEEGRESSVSLSHNPSDSIEMWTQDDIHISSEELFSDSDEDDDSDDDEDGLLVFPQSASPVTMMKPHLINTSRHVDSKQQITPILFSPNAFSDFAGEFDEEDLNKEGGEYVFDSESDTDVDDEEMDISSLQLHLVNKYSQVEHQNDMGISVGRKIVV